MNPYLVYGMLSFIAANVVTNRYLSMGFAVLAIVEFVISMFWKDDRQ